MFDTWRKWLEVMENDISWLLKHRGTFYRVMESGQERGLKDAGSCSDLISLLWDGYVVFAGTTVRRLADEDLRERKQSISLPILLKNLKASIGALTRQNYLGAFPGPKVAPDAGPVARELAAEAIAGRTFDKVAGPEAKEVTPAMIDADIATVAAICGGRLKDYVDKWMAHTDRNQAQFDALFGELNKAIDALHELFKKYYLLIMNREYDPPPLDTDELDECLDRMWGK